MAKADQAGIGLRIIVEQPVPGVAYSLQAKDGTALDPKRSRDGNPLVFDLTIRIASGPKFYGDQVKAEGPVRRFVYIRVGELAGDQDSPWSRRIKLDIHDIDPELLRAIKDGLITETRIAGTGADGTPACATVTPISRRVVVS